MGRRTGAVTLTILSLLGSASALPDIVSTPVRAFGFGEISTAIASPNGAWLATAGQAGAFLWDYEKRTVRHRLEAPHTMVLALAFSPDNRILLTGGRDGVIREWDTDSGDLVREHIGHSSEITSLAYSSDGMVFASSSGDNSARVWSVASGDVLHTVVVPGQWISTAAFSPDGLLLATADSSITNNIRIWSLTSGEMERALGLHIGQVWALSFLPDGRLASGGDDRKVRIWDAQTGSVVRTLEGGGLSFVNGLATSSETIIAGFDSGLITIWDEATGVATKQMPTERFWQLSAAPASNSVITIQADLTVRTWDLTTETIIAEFEGHTTSTIQGVTFSPDGTSVIAGGTEENVRVWNRSNADLAQTIAAGQGGTSTTVLSPDGKLLLTTAGNPTPKLRLWNLDAGEHARDFGWSSGWPSAAAYSADGARVAAGTMTAQVHLFDASTGSGPETLTGHASAVRSLAFSSDSTLLASGDTTGTVRIWNAQNGQWQRTLTINAGWVTAVAFSPSTNELMTASEDGFVHIWNPNTGALLRTIPVTGGFLEAAAYSPNGRYFVTGEGWPFFVAELWDAYSGELLRVFSGHSAPVKSVAISADGMSVLTGSDVVRLWDLSDLLLQIHSERTANGITLRWREGVLQHAGNVNGPWADVLNATSPRSQITDDGSGFFRVRMPRN